MNLSPAVLMTSSLCLSLFACGTSHPTTPEKPVTAKETAIIVGPKLIGRIAAIPADKRFVLIQSYGKWEIEAGAILTTRGPDERTANLRVTGEKLGEFAAADLQSGTLETGDAVYSQSAPLPPSPPPAPELAQSKSEADDQSIPKAIKF